MAEIYRDEVVQTALDQVGYSSGSSKSSKYSKELDKASFYNYAKDGASDWCAILNDWEVYKNTSPQTADNARAIVYEPSRDNCGAGCKWKIDYYRAHNAFYAHKAKGCPAEIGDEVFFWDKKYISSANPYGVYHTGRVVAWDNEYIYTVEGNTNGKGDVSKRSYSYGNSKLYGYGRPNWTAKTRPQPNPAPDPEPAPDVQKYQVKVGDYLSIRTGPSTDFEKIGELLNGAIVTILEERDGWGRITGDSWVSMSYLKAI